MPSFTRDIRFRRHPSGSTPTPTPEDSRDPERIYLFEPEQDKVETVSAGGEVVVSLVEEPGLPLKWLQSGIAPQFKLQDESKKDFPGPTQTRVFRYEAVSAGEGKLRFVLRNPWQNRAEAVRTVEFTVIVA